MFEAQDVKPSAIVFGSINMDLVVKTPQLPVPGETLLGHEFFTSSGGKGANQAVALARLGVPTQIVGRVGGDSFGSELVDSLQTAGVQTEYILVDQAVNSGIAAIAVDDTGENQIIIVPGANGRVDATDVKRLASLLPGVSALLLQLEIPMSAVLAAAQAARYAGVTVILDPAPAQIKILDELYGLIDIITPNENEAGQLVGFAVKEPNSAIDAAAILRQRGVETAIIKLGDRGVVCATQEETFFVPAFPVTAIDTVAAGDAFNGGLAAALVEGLSTAGGCLGCGCGGISSDEIGGAVCYVRSPNT